MSSLTFSYDIGHASIGWAVTDKTQVLGTGTVVFPAEDNQNQKRSAHRSTRRNIAATRNRIKRLSLIFEKKGWLTLAELAQKSQQGNGDPFPWLLAAKVFRQGIHLNTSQLFDVLRWYAHNRGYLPPEWGGADPAEQEDVQRVERAINCMKELGTETMAETVCAYLKVDVDSEANPNMGIYYKKEGFAFPRKSIVEPEIRRLLEHHIGAIDALDTAFIDGMCSDASLIQFPNLTKAEQLLMKPRAGFKGGMLTGQAIPRFENRIISLCPLTLYRDKTAKKLKNGNYPIKGEKVPKKHCPEFYRFRFAMLLANLRVSGESGKRELTASERQTIFGEMETLGFLSKKRFFDLLKTVTQAEPDKTSGASAATDDFDGLDISPAKRACLRPFEIGVRTIDFELLKQIWGNVPEESIDEISKGDDLSWSKILKASPNPENLKSDLHQLYNSTLGKSKPGKKKKIPTFAELLEQEIKNSKTDGRAPYSRKIMNQAVEEVLQGLHPSRGPSDSDDGGCLYMTEEMRLLQAEIPLDELCNNHLVRHRLLIFEKLYQDMLKNYAKGNVANIESIVLEVARDLREYSGMNAQQKVDAFKMKQRPFQKAAADLQKMLDDEGIDQLVRYNWIRKVRIWEDQGRKCPYTGKEISIRDIVNNNVEFEHIIPRSQRPTDALDALVLSFNEVNAKKGNRTAVQFIEACQNEKIAGKDGLAWQVMTPQQYDKHVKSLELKGRPRTDAERTRKRRSHWLQMRDYDPLQDNFLNRDLTQTGYLNKLAGIKLRQSFSKWKQSLPEMEQKRFKELQMVHLEGTVTSFFKKAWRLDTCLAEIEPACRDENGKARRKHELRGITHLHHAIDAITLGLSYSSFPSIKHKMIREWIARQKIPTPGDRNALLQDAGDSKLINWRDDTRFEPAPITPDMRKSVKAALLERRVVQHLPKKMRGLVVDELQVGYLGHSDSNGKMSISVAAKKRKEDGCGREKRETKSFSSKNALGFENHPLKEYVSPASKMVKNKSLLRVSENFGVALLEGGDSEVIPFINVKKWITKLTIERNSRKHHAIIPKGTVIEVLSKNATESQKQLKGQWKVCGIKDTARDGIQLVLVRPWMIPPIGSKLKKWSSMHNYYKSTASLSTLRKLGLNTRKGDYTKT